MKRLLLCCPALLCGLLLTACGGGEAALEGWYLQTENSGHFIITEDGATISMSGQSHKSSLFDGLNSGDRIKITHSDIAESDPLQTTVDSCQLLTEGTPEDIPQEALAHLEELGYTFSFHSHSPAGEPLTVEDPVSGYCGNTVTTVFLNDQEYSFWGSDSVTLTDILINLAYDPDQICRCLPEIVVDTEFGSGYGVNLSEAYARCDAGQAALTATQVETIREILQRNCI